MDKIFFHVDVNSAFLSWSAIRQVQAGREDLRLIASAVGGDEKSRHGVVLAKSTLAKKAGVRTGESLFSARKKCPELVVVPPEFDWYVKNSHAMISIMQDFTPDVEQYSIDEAFLDMTGMEKLMGAPLEAAEKLKSRIKNELGFTVNIGISSNRLLAKMASDFEKPDKIHTLFPNEIKDKMWHLPVGELFGVGRSTVKALNNMGFYTIGNVAKADKQLLRSRLGVIGDTVWDYANGIESTPIIRKETKENSYGNSVTTGNDITTPQEAVAILLSLTESVAGRMRLDGKKAGVVAVTLVDSDFNRRSHQCSLGFTTNTTDIIYENAVQLLYDMWDDKPVRLIGVSAGKAVREEYEQMSLFEDEHADKLKKLDAAMDEIRDKFGDRAVVRARLLGSNGPGGLSNAKARSKKGGNHE
ncbi:MAG: DNA polymerase IV [Bacteroides sp.]|nr:DNA polymerase IV [Clostridia bacterium]